MEAPITQSKKWQRLQDDLKEPNFYREEPHYHYLAIKKSTPLGSYLYVPYGPVADDKKSFTLALDSLINLAHDENAFFIRIEPENPDFKGVFPQKTFKSHDLNPKETWLLSLEGEESDLNSRLPSRLLRYYKNREKSGLTIETSKDPADIKYLLDFQKSLAKEKNISTFSENYLKTELEQPFATLYLVKYKDPCKEATGQAKNREEIVAAGLVFDHEKTRYNLQGAQNDQGRKLHATGILTIQLIKDAYDKGLKNFDFWGIAPEGASENHPWAGFTNFKKTFEGQEIDYAGTHDIVLNLPKYKLYQILRAIRRRI